LDVKNKNINEAIQVETYGEIKQSIELDLVYDTISQAQQQENF